MMKVNAGMRSRDSGEQEIQWKLHKVITVNQEGSRQLPFGLGDYLKLKAQMKATLLSSILLIIG